MLGYCSTLGLIPQLVGIIIIMWPIQLSHDVMLIIKLTLWILLTAQCYTTDKQDQHTSPPETKIKKLIGIFILASEKLTLYTTKVGNVQKLQQISISNLQNKRASSKYSWFPLQLCSETSATKQFIFNFCQSIIVNQPFL